MLKDLSDERVDEIASDLNDVQRECFTAYCRKLPNGIGLIHGPGGTGKTRGFDVHLPAEEAQSPLAGGNISQ